VKITVERIKEIIKEEHEKMSKEGPIFHAQGLGTYGEHPAAILHSAAEDIEKIYEGIAEARDMLRNMIKKEYALDAEDLEYMVGKLNSSLVDNAIAKLQGALERQLKVHEVKNDKNRT